MELKSKEQLERIIDMILDKQDAMLHNGGAYEGALDDIRILARLQDEYAERFPEEA